MKMKMSSFISSTSDEPHATRRKIILKKYPEIKQLMVIDPTIKWKALLLVISQFYVYYLISDVTNWYYLTLIAYVYIGTSTHSLVLAGHEIIHGQAFGHNSPKLSYLWLIIVNLPTGVPHSFTLKRHHARHHRYLGDRVIDYDAPTEFEARHINTKIRKLFFVIFASAFYTFRTIVLCPSLDRDETIGWIIQLTTNVLIYKVFGFNVFMTMILSLFLGGSLHPCSGHFLTEHFVWDNMAVKPDLLDSSCANSFDMIPDTRSYYGPMNYVLWNIGYHIEHHDFPSIPGSKLPMVRKIAPEFYDYPHHTSMIRVLYYFIMNDNATLFQHVKRDVYLKKTNKVL